MKIGMYSVEIKRPSVSELFHAIREKGFVEVQFDFASVCAEQMPPSMEPGLLQAVSAAARENEETYLAHGKDIQEGAGLSFTHAGNGIVDFPYFLQKLKACGYNGGMLLHGIKKEEYFEPSVSFIRDIISKNWH